MIDISLDSVLRFLGYLLDIVLDYGPPIIRMIVNEKVRASLKKIRNANVLRTMINFIAITSIRFGIKLAPALLDSRTGDRNTAITNTKKKPALAYTKNMTSRTKTCGKSDIPGQTLKTKPGKKTRVSKGHMAPTRVSVLGDDGIWFETNTRATTSLISANNISHKPLLTPTRKGKYGLIVRQKCKRCFKYFFYTQTTRPRNFCDTCSHRKHR